MSKQTTERTHFEALHLGAPFTHNNINYVKLSESYAELSDNTRAELQRNSYFDGPTVVYAQSGHIRKATRK